jgi:tripartite-type tricarboxylate transporter receptor subunit TctC
VVSKSAPDGHTVVYGTSGMLVYGNFLFKNRTFDTVKDYAPITQSFSTPQYVTINNTVPANSLQELIALAKKNPGKLEYGSTGPGSYFHLAGEALKNAAGIDLLHVPYAQANFAQLVSDWSTGRIAVFFPTLAQIKPNQAKVKPLAVFDTKRTKALPDVPAITEVLPNYKPFVVWYGFFGPVGLPPAVAKRFADETVRAMKVPEVVAKIDSLGMHIVGSSPEELAASLREEMDTIGKLVKTLGLHPE